MVWSTRCLSTGPELRCQRAGFSVGSARSTATERVEFNVNATEYGSVTRLVSTVPVVGAKTTTSNRYRAPRHWAPVSALHDPSERRIIGTRVAWLGRASAPAEAGQSSTETFCAVGAQSTNEGARPLQVTP